MRLPGTTWSVRQTRVLVLFSIVAETSSFPPCGDSDDTCLKLAQVWCTGVPYSKVESGPCLAAESLCQTPSDHGTQRKRPCSPWVSQLSTQAINRVRSQVLNGRSSHSSIQAIEHDEVPISYRQVDMSPSSPSAAITAELTNRVSDLSAAMRLQIQRVDLIDTEFRHWRSQRETELKHHREEMQLREDYDLRLHSLETRMDSQSASSKEENDKSSGVTQDSLQLTELRVRLDALEIRSAQKAKEQSTPDEQGDRPVRQLAFRADHAEDKLAFLEQSISKLNEAIVAIQRSSASSGAPSLESCASLEHLHQAMRTLEERIEKAEVWMPTVRSAGNTVLFDKRLGRVEEWVASANDSRLLEVGMPMIQQCDAKLLEFEKYFEDIVQKLERSLQLAAGPASEVAEHKAQMLDLDMRVGSLTQELGNLRDICVGSGKPMGEVKLSTIAENVEVGLDFRQGGHNQAQYCSLFDSLVKEPDGVMPRLATHDKRINGIIEACRKQDNRSDALESLTLERLQSLEAELQSIANRDNQRAEEITQLASWTSSPIVDRAFAECQQAKPVPIDVYTRDQEEIVHTLARTEERLHLMEAQVTRFVESAYTFTLATAQNSGVEESIVNRLERLESELYQRSVLAAPASGTGEALQAVYEEVKQELQKQISLKDDKVESLTSSVSEGISELNSVVPMVQQLRSELHVLATKESGVDALTTAITSGIGELRTALASVSANGSPLMKQIQKLRSELFQHQDHLDSSSSSTSAIIETLKATLTDLEASDVKEHLASDVAV